MNPLIKNWRITVLAVFLLLATVPIVLNSGLILGIDFEGGTLFQIELQDQVSSEEITKIANIISQRIDPAGLRDVTVSPVGGKFIIIQMSETTPSELEKIESRIRQQGKFESTLNGEIIFTGDEISTVLRGSPTYGVRNIGDSFMWRLPFVLNEAATRRFTEKTFHQCEPISFANDGRPVYECEVTFFFLDKPEALIVMSEEQYYLDSDALFLGNLFAGFPQETDIEKLVENMQLPLIVYSEQDGLDNNVLATALQNFDEAIVSPDLDPEVTSALEEKGFLVTKAELKEGFPWIWTAVNARQVISLTESVTNEDVVDISQAELFSNLNITGQRQSVELAFEDLEELTILLESGSLPTPVKSISRETISPSLGEAFKETVVWMGLIALITVVIVILVRYKLPKLAVPIFLTGLSEVWITLGFLTAVGRPLDLAAFAGLIAAVGTGVDSQIVIADEIIRGEKEAHESLLHRAKNAFFIIMAAALTTIGVMVPILVFSFGLGKLVGFAITVIVGALIGIFITRPAFSMIVQKIVK